MHGTGNQGGLVHWWVFATNPHRDPPFVGALSLHRGEPVVDSSCCELSENPLDRPHFVTSSLSFYQGGQKQVSPFCNSLFFLNTSEDKVFITIREHGQKSRHYGIPLQLHTSALCPTPPFVSSHGFGRSCSPSQAGNDHGGREELLHLFPSSSPHRLVMSPSLA